VAQKQKVEKVMQKFFAIKHRPTDKLFPFMNAGSTYYDFMEDDFRPKHKFIPPPRLFGSRHLANRYVTEYCKGIRDPQSFASKCVYSDPKNERKISDFDVVEVELMISPSATPGSYSER